MFRAVFVAAFGLLFQGGPALGGDLNLTIEGVRSDKGMISVGIYAAKAHWPNGSARQAVDFTAKAGSVTYTIKNLAPGRYAISGFHDENDNKILDKTLIGVPKEGFFFSRDAHPHLSSPGFDECAFDVGDGPESITIHVQYWTAAQRDAPQTN